MLHEKGRPEAAHPESSAVAADTSEGSTQLDVFAAIDEAVRLRNEGMASALHGEDVRIVSAIEAEVRRLASLGIEFQPDDVMPQLASRRAVGAVFSKLARAGVIRCVGARNSTRPERHGAITRVWRGGDAR